jgi:hypothetical protein
LIKRVVLIVAIVAGAIALGIYLMQREEDRLARLTAQSPAQVTAVSVRIDQESGEESTVIDYSFAAGGRTLQDQSTQSGNLREPFARGAAVVACYDPADPTESEVFPAGHSCSGAAGPAPGASATPASSGMSAEDLDMVVPD